MTRKIAIILCCALGFFLWKNFSRYAGAEEKPKIYTVKSSVEEAMAASYTLKAIKERLNQATSVKNQARAEFLPYVPMDHR